MLQTDLAIAVITSQHDCGPDPLRWFRPLPPPSSESSAIECFSELVDVKVVSTIAGVNVGDHRDHVEVGGEEHRRVTGSRPGEGVSELVSGGGDRCLRGGEADYCGLTFDTSGAR